MITVGQVLKRVQAKVDDQDATYCTEQYLEAFVQETLDWIYNQFRLTGSQFCESVVVVPNVPAGAPNLDDFTKSGQPLNALVTPRMIRWRIPGQDATHWRRADGPLDYIRDMPQGTQALDSWAWMKYSIKLSNYAQILDLEISGDFLFDPIKNSDSTLQITANAARAFTCKLAQEVGKARGNDKWVTTYGADADEAIDDLRMALVKENQGKTHRVGRMSRSSNSSTRYPTVGTN
jgi:hypothetical protein